MKKPLDMTGILTSNAAAAKPLTAAPADKPTPRPRVAAEPAPVVPARAPAEKPVGLTHKLDSERYAWLRGYLQAEQIRRGDFRYSGQQFYVEAFDTMRQAIDAGLTVAEVRAMIASRANGG